MNAIHHLAKRFPHNEQILAICKSNLSHPQCNINTAYQSARTVIMHDKEKTDPAILNILAGIYDKLDELLSVDGDDDGHVREMYVLGGLLEASEFLPSDILTAALIKYVKEGKSRNTVFGFVQELLLKRNLKRNFIV